MKKAIMMLFVAMTLIMSSVISAYGDEIGITRENVETKSLKKRSIRVATLDEETGKTVYSEIELEDFGDQILSVDGTVNANRFDNAENSTLGIIGEDNRIQITNTTQLPYSAICHIDSGFDSNNDGVADKHIFGTGTMIGPNTVATAAHLIYSDTYDTWASYVRVYPGKNGTSNPFGYTSRSELWVSGEWNREHNYPNAEDWGLIELSDPLGEKCGFFGLSTNATNNMNVTLTGYSEDKNSGTTMWRSPGKITILQDNYLHYDCDMMPGNSGSPIYNNSTQLIGINAYERETLGYNAGPRLTSFMFQYFYSARLQYGKTGPGYLDAVNVNQIGGWAMDSNDRYKNKDVHIYVKNNGTNETAHFGAINANGFRSDVGLHGFAYPISWLKFKPATYRVEAYAIGINGTNPALRNSGMLYVVEPSEGHVDSVTASNGVKGWVWKPDAPNDAIEAHLYVYDSSGNKVFSKAIKAGEYRQDLVNAGKGNGYHGFTYKVNWASLPKGNLTVKVYSVDDSGVNPLIYSGTYNNQ